MTKMRVMDPSGESAHPTSKLAPRPSTIEGKVVWFVDGYGDTEDGKPVMNKIFRRWKERLETEHKLAEVHWVRTDNIATPYRHGKETFEQMVKTADLVINGVAL